MLSKFISAFILLCLVFFGIYKLSQKEKVLCLEVGHTRIKTALLPKNPSLKDLQKTKTFAFLSKPWLNKNLEQLFKKNKDNPLNPLFIKSPSEISLSIFGPIYDRKVHGCAEKDGIYTNLKDVLQKECLTQLKLESDSVSWACGALEFLRLQSKDVKYPCLAFTFGTGPGVALIESPQKVSAIEVWVMKPSFKRLTPFAKPYGYEEWPYKILKKDFLDKQEMNGCLETFNHHVEAFVEDVCEHVQGLFTDLPNIQTILIGGGLSRYITLKNPKYHVLNPQYLTKQGVSPDIIQLLGCERLCRDDSIVTKTFPSIDELRASSIVR